MSEPIVLASHSYINELTAQKLYLSNDRYGLHLGNGIMHTTRIQWDQLHADGIAAFDAADAHQSVLDGMLPAADVSGIAYQSGELA